MNRTFLLGLGCMKGGTTWLHDYLAGSPQCEPGIRKEYHVFDSRDAVGDTAREPWVLSRVLARASTALEDLAAGRPEDATFLQQAAMIGDEQLYFDYVAGLFSRGPDVRLTLDVTPGYAVLPAARLAAIRTEVERRGLRAVSLFLLRDPVERIWSQVRMQQRRRPGHNPGTAEDLVRARFAEASYADRTRYDHTVRAADEGFGEHAAYAFYEELFAPGTADAELRRLCGLLGIDHREPDLGTRFNASPRTGDLPQGTVRAVAEHYADVYRFVADRFPDRDLRAIWPSARFVL